MEKANKTERVAHPGEIELCLCHRCASNYYNMQNRGIQRADPLQVEKDPCDICSYRLGYDFYIWPMSNVRKKKNVQIRTFAKGGQNE